jgi:DNA-directed RNA polymerase subunit L
LKLEIVSVANDAIQVKMDGEDYSVADIVHMELLELKHVKFAGVAPPHPLLKTLTIQIHTDGADSTKALLEALKNSQGKMEVLLSAARETFPPGRRPENLVSASAGTESPTIL